jgi:hypothetical protein
LKEKKINAKRTIISDPSMYSAFSMSKAKTSQVQKTPTFSLAVAYGNVLMNVQNDMFKEEDFSLLFNMKN